jgi:hypothetical protein
MNKLFRILVLAVAASGLLVTGALADPDRENGDPETPQITNPIPPIELLGQGGTNLLGSAKQNSAKVSQPLALRVLRACFRVLRSFSF